jgi:large subunit ribosomal protein L6
MSRIGKKPIPLAKATVEMNGNAVTVKGPKGQLTREILDLVSIEVEEQTLYVKRKTRLQRSPCSAWPLPFTLCQYG